jgi:hypothetical protein
VTWLLFLNYYVFRWFMFRLARVVDDETEVQQGWTIVWCWPNSGWDGKPIQRLGRSSK